MAKVCGASLFGNCNKNNLVRRCDKVAHIQNAQPQFLSVSRNLNQTLQPEFRQKQTLQEANSCLIQSYQVTCLLLYSLGAYPRQQGT